MSEYVIFEKIMSELKITAQLECRAGNDEACRLAEEIEAVWRIVKKCNGGSQG